VTRVPLRALAALLCLLLVCALLPAARAGSLATVRHAAVPALPAGVAAQALLAVQSRMVALVPGAAWVLAEDGRGWLPAGGVTADGILGAASQGGVAVLLRGSGGRVDRVSRLLLTPTPAGAVLAEQALPALPQPLAAARAAVTAAGVHVAGLDADGRPQLLQWSFAAESPRWQPRGGWPDGGAPSAVLAQTGAVFVASADAQGGPDRLARWSADRGWQARPPVPGRVLPGAVRATGQAHGLFLVDAPGGAAAAPLMKTLHTITGSWADLAPAASAVAGPVAAWHDGLLWVTPGSGFTLSEVESGKQLLRWLDWIVIVVYLGSMLGMGGYFYLREKRNSTSDFFVGGRSIPFWAAGVSLYAANTSSISYIAIPAKAFETNWQYMTNNLIAVMGLMFVAVWIVPLLRRLDLMSVFSYLETRFHPAIRMMASGLCIAVQIGSRMSVVLFLPSLAIATITGIDVVWSVLMMGGFTIVYTAMGGMKAVIWTDFVQLFVKMGGAVFAIGFMIWSLKGGLPEFIGTAMAEDKMKLLDFSFDLTKATVWGFVFLVLFDVVLTFPKDQVLMQRTLSTTSDKEAGRSIWTFAAIMIPGGIVFYSIGTALFVYYKNFPERMNPLLSIDATFPLFIAAELPMGVTGLIIAGIFAAAMATLSSIMNSVATLASVDFYEKLARHPTPRSSVLFAEVSTVVAGLLGIAGALLLSRFDIHSLFDVSIELAGLLGGGFAGAYTLGMFTRRANSQGVAVGVACSIVLTTLAWSMKLVHPYFYLAISILLCIVIGYVASLFFPAPTRSLRGLTIYADGPPEAEARGQVA